MPDVGTIGVENCLSAISIMEREFFSCVGPVMCVLRAN